MDKIKIGWSEVSLVPEGRKVKLCGQFYERITDEVESPITVTAIALECGTEQAIFCSCDLCGTSYKLLEAVRERLAVNSAFPVDKVILNAIHTHTSILYAGGSDAPVISGSSLDILARFVPENMKYEELVKADDENILQGEEAFEFLADKIAKAAYEAWNNRAEGLYATGFGRAAVGMCRRVCYDDGSAKMWGDTNMANFTELEGGNDSGIELMFTYDEGKNITGVVANVACPSQVLEHRSFISSDYWGKVKEILRERLGKDIFVLGLCSAAGDQCPRDMIRWIEPETSINDPNIVRDTYIERNADPSMFDIKGCKLVGRRIADEIMYAYEDVSEYIGETELVHKVLNLDMPVRRVTIEETEKAKRAIKEFVNESSGTFTFKENAAMHVYAGTIARYEAQQKFDTNTIEVHVLKLGNIVFATNPYELFLDYGNKIRARSKARQTFLIQLSCGSLGYLPTEKAEKGSHYSAYVSSGINGHEAGDLLIRKTLTEINNMWE